MSALGPKGRSWAQVSFQERKGFEKEFLHCSFCCKMYFLGLGTLELLGNEQEIHDLWLRGCTPHLGNFYVANLLQQEMRGKLGVLVPCGSSLEMTGSGPWALTVSVLENGKERWHRKLLTNKYPSLLRGLEGILLEKPPLPLTGAAFIVTETRASL